jgi:hypothetical protein
MRHIKIGQWPWVRLSEHIGGTSGQIRWTAGAPCPSRWPCRTPVDPLREPFSVSASSPEALAVTNLGGYRPCRWGTALDRSEMKFNLSTEGSQ